MSKSEFWSCAISPQPKPESFATVLLLDYCHHEKEGSMNEMLCNVPLCQWPQHACLECRGVVVEGEEEEGSGVADLPILFASTGHPRSLPRCAVKCERTSTRIEYAAGDTKVHQACLMQPIEAM